MAGNQEQPGDVRYEVSDKPPHALSAALAAQTVMVILAGIVLTPVIVLRAGGVVEQFAAWAIFVALLVSGLCTMLQARPVWRFGAGYILFMGTSGAFISVGVTAILEGGMALLMTLIVASSLIQFPLAANLGLLRRIITPTVGGTAIMLIAVTVMPIAFGLMSNPAATGEPVAVGAAASAIATLATIVGVSIFGGKRGRLWAPLVGLICGSGVAGAYGLIDLGSINSAAWIGLPAFAWPGFDLSFGPAFWELLPAFAIVTLVGAIETFGDGIAIQRVSWRKPRAVDFRSVQGAVYADGLGNLLSGLGGTLPNTTYSTSVSVVDMTGVAARRIGLYGGILLALLAFSPKIAAVLLTVPNAVVGAYIIVLLVLLFMHGVKLATEEGITYENILIVGLGFWLGVGFQQKALFYDLMPAFAQSLLSNGMTAGTIVAILLTLLFRAKRGRPKRLATHFSVASVPQVHEFIESIARRAGWDKPAINRLQLAAEEALVVMLEKAKGTADDKRLLRVEVRQDEGMIELDLITAPRGANLEDELPLVMRSAAPPEDMLSFRILSSIVDDIRHQQFHGIDIVTLKVSSRPL
ncbi:MAG: solute carrier family 23 protein [Rhodospirillaceae bacterium]|nr:solute carrier family 23 protein [Rhodospirillaceae bacterium]